MFFVWLNRNMSTSESLAKIKGLNAISCFVYMQIKRYIKALVKNKMIQKEKLCIMPGYSSPLLLVKRKHQNLHEIYADFYALNVWLIKSFFFCFSSSKRLHTDNRTSHMWSSLYHWFLETNCLRTYPNHGWYKVIMEDAIMFSIRHLFMVSNKFQF